MTVYHNESIPKSRLHPGDLVWVVFNSNSSPYISYSGIAIIKAEPFPLRYDNIQVGIPKNSRCYSVTIDKRWVVNKVGEEKVFKWWEWKK
jgi:hypothetical protein